MMSLSPFDFLNSINTKKEDIMVDDLAEKDYNGFMVNRGLSYFQDTVALANLMNQYHHVDDRMQYDFLRIAVRQRKRFSKWHKQKLPKDIEYIKEYYGYSDRKALNALQILSKEQVDFIKRKLSKGGSKP